jgi:hypothetical protein
MMMDLTPNPEGERARMDREVPAASPLGERPLTDREVPLSANGSMAALNAWLDGEAPAPRLANNQLTPEAELWSRISREASARKSVRTPTHVAAQIMNALPPATATRLVAAPAVQSVTAKTATATRATPVPTPTGFNMNPIMIAALAIGFMALGAFIARMM